jgi:cytochrome c-type biogenesis protein CcmE
VSSNRPLSQPWIGFTIHVVVALPVVAYVFLVWAPSLPIRLLGALVAFGAGRLVARGVDRLTGSTRLVAAAIAATCALAATAWVAIAKLHGGRRDALLRVTLEDIERRGASLDGVRVDLLGSYSVTNITKRVAPCEYRFDLSDDTHELGVRYAECTMPEVLDRDRPGARFRVHVTGTMSSGVLEADSVAATVDWP